MNVLSSSAPVSFSGMWQQLKQRRQKPLTEEQQHVHNLKELLSNTPVLADLQGAWYANDLHINPHNQLITVQMVGILPDRMVRSYQFHNDGSVTETLKSLDNPSEKTTQTRSILSEGSIPSQLLTQARRKIIDTHKRYNVPLRR